jgi:hypothetical protein
MAGTRTSPSVFDDLADEWTRLADDPSTAFRFRRWSRRFPVLAPHGSLAALVVWCRDRTVDPALRDRAQISLATLSVEGDELAARALLEAVTPALHRMVESLSWIGESRADRAQLVVAAAWEQIRTYPVVRRPAKVVPNILADTRKGLCRSPGNGRPPDTDLSLVPDAAAERPDSATIELWRLLSDAVADGILSPSAAALIARSRIFDEPVERLGADGEPAQTVRRRRLRAETVLRSAVAVVPPSGSNRDRFEGAD